MRDVPDFLGDRRGLDEELVRGVRKHLPRPLEVDDRVDHHVGNVHALGPTSRAIDSARIRCAALVGAKPAKPAFPRIAEVLPVVMMAPSPAATIAGASRRARWSRAIVLTWKFRFSTSGSISRKFPNVPPTALWTSTFGVPCSALTASRVLCSAASSVTSQG